MNSVKKLFYILLLGGVIALNAKSVEYAYEDAYLKQAPAEIIKVADEAAVVVGFDQPFEVTMPTKAGIQVNPLNTFITVGRHPLSRNVFLIINPEWFLALSQDEQTFLVGRSLMQTVPNGYVYYLIKYLLYIFSFLNILFLIFVYILLGKTLLKGKKWWMKLLAVLVFSVIWGTFVTEPFILNLKARLGKRFDMQVIRTVIQKTGNKQAAIQSLEKYNTGIQAISDRGDNSLAAYVGLFQQYANELKQ